MGFVVGAISAIGAAISSVIGAKAAAALGSFALSALASVGANLAMSALQRAIMGSPKTPDRPPVGVRVRVSYGEDQFQTAVLGRYATAGDVVYSASFGTGKIPNEMMVKVIELSDLPVAGLRRVMVNGEWVELYDPNPSGLRPVRQYRIKGKDYLWIRFYDGHQSAADPWLVSNLGTHPEMPWTADMVGRGIAYAIVVARSNAEVHRGFPEVLFELDGVPLYDPRKDSSVGGSGPHRWGQPETYEPTNNLQVISYNIFRGIHHPHDGRFWWGMQGVGAPDLPLSEWFAAMNECDVPIARDGDDPEPQYHGGIEVSTEHEPRHIIEELNKGSQAEVAEVAGVWTVRAGPPGLPVHVFTDGDIVTTEGDTFEPFVGVDRSYNGVRATYVSPEEAWEMKEAPERINPDALAEAGGRHVFADISLPAVLSPTHAQRLMQAAILDHARQVRHSLVLPPEACVIGPLATVAWNSDRFQYVAKQFEVGMVEPTPGGNQAMMIREVNPDDWAWSPGDADPVEITDPVRPPALPAPIVGFRVEPAWEEDSNGRQRRAAIRLLWDADDLGPDVFSIRYEVRLPARESVVEQDNILHDGTPDEEGEPVDYPLLAAPGVPVLVAPDIPLIVGSYVDDVRRGFQLITKGILPATGYEVRARYVRHGRSDPWSDWLPVTTFDIRLGELDLDEYVRQRLADVGEARQRAQEALDSAVDLYDRLDLVQTDLERFGANALTLQPDPSNPTRLELVTFRDGDRYTGVARLEADAFLANTTIYARHIVTGAFANELPDSQMQDPASWQGLGPHATLLPDGAPPVSRSAGMIRFLGTSHDGTGYHRVTSAPFAVEPEKEYVVRCHVRLTNGNAALWDFLILWLDDKGQEVGADQIAEIADLARNALEEVEETVTAPPAARKAVLRWRVHAGSTTGRVEVFSGHVRRKTAAIEMQDGFLSAEHVSAEFLDALEINARQVNVTETLRLTAARAGFSAGKTGPDDLATPGIYFGAGQNEEFALIAGVLKEGFSQDLRITERDGLRLLNARHAITFEAPAPAVEVTSNGFVNLPPGTTQVQVTLVPGGGGGSSGHWNSGRPSVPGEPGGNTIVRLYNGSTNTGRVWTAIGGIAGVGRENKSSPNGGRGPLYIGASHGVGARYKSRAAGSGIRGGGGGSGAGTSGRSGRPGESGQFITVNIDVRQYANPRLQITIGKGGKGGRNSKDEYWLHGGDGGDGLVSYVTRSFEEIPADVLSLAITHEGSFTKTANVAGSFPDLGPGAWYITTDGALNGLALGRIKVGPREFDWKHFWHEQSAFFIAEQTPTWEATANTRTIYYKFRAMGRGGGGS